MGINIIYATNIMTDRMHCVSIKSTQINSAFILSFLWYELAYIEQQYHSSLMNLANVAIASFLCQRPSYQGKRYPSSVMDLTTREKGILPPSWTWLPGKKVSFFRHGLDFQGKRYPSSLMDLTTREKGILQPSWTWLPGIKVFVFRHGLVYWLREW